MPKKSKAVPPVPKGYDVEAVNQLREWFPRGSTMYSILRSCNRNGTSRVISPVAIRCDMDAEDAVQIRFPSYWVGVLLGLKTRESLGGFTGVVVGGGGEDKGFRICYDVSSVIWGDGYAIDHKWL
jgi:hypothetical protein